MLFSHSAIIMTENRIMVHTIFAIMAGVATLPILPNKVDTDKKNNKILCQIHFLSVPLHRVPWNTHIYFICSISDTNYHLAQEFIGARPDTYWSVRIA